MFCNFYYFIWINFSDDDLLDQCQAMCSEITAKMEKSPDLYRPAMRARLTSYRNI